MKLIVKTLLGAEEILSKELQSLGATNVEVAKKNVTCEADKETLYKICYCARLATRVMVNLLEFPAEDANDIYNNVRAFDWSSIISPKRTMCIDHVSFSQKLGDSDYIALKVKDDIMDQLREKIDATPRLSDDNPDVLVNVHATDERVTVSIDSCGAPLNRRGYRPENLELDVTNEVMAAALVELSGWTPDQTLIDPMCGTGTICIEAAMKGRNIPAQMFRKYPFGFENTLDFDPELWAKVKADAESKITSNRLRISGSDVDTEAIDIAKMTTLDMKLTTEVRINRRSVREQSRMTQEGVVITCPPTDPEQTKRGLEDLYKEITHYMARNFLDHDVWIYSTSEDALDAIPFDAEKEIPFAEGSFNLYPF